MIIQWSDEDEVYIVTLPEFHGCKTHGRTYAEAGRMGQEVLELLIETYQADGTPLPKPLKFGCDIAPPEVCRPAKQRSGAINEC
jgi:predicted RNase H-like HicB family nuclease